MIDARSITEGLGGVFSFPCRRVTPSPGLGVVAGHRDRAWQPDCTSLAFFGCGLSIPPYRSLCKVNIKMKRQDHFHRAAFMPVPEAARYLGIGRKMAYQGLENGVLALAREGGATRVGGGNGRIVS
jgi:hypothetical protein